jgi:tellurite resistance protein
MSSEEEEEKYIKRMEAEKLEEQRRERQLEALKLKEREKVREQLKTSEEVAEEALELGFDSTTARVLPLVPMIEMAWADGTVTSGENQRVLEIADQLGLEPGEPAHNFLKMMLFDRPSDLFFERVNRVIAHLIEDNPEEWEGKSVVEFSKEVAEASGGFFGLFDSISEEERRLLEEFAELFSVDTRTLEGDSDQ